MKEPSLPQLGDAASGAQRPYYDWRLCIDFGTAASKAAIGNQSGWGGPHGAHVQPLPLGLHAGNADPLLVPSALYIDKERIYFGPAALYQAGISDAEREPLQSFKMLLGAADLPTLLKSAVKRSLDPSGQFLNKDVLVLYIAYLSALIAECFAADPALNAIRDQVRWRYCHPEWRGARAATHISVTKALFETGVQAGAYYKSEFLSDDGIAISRALQIANAEPAASNGLIEGGVFEAHAAGAAHAGASQLTSPIVMVFDMGAGTTDFDGFKIVQAPGGAMQMVQIAEARRTIVHAGDEVDKILMNAFIDRANLSKSVKAQSALWRSMAASIRDIKRQAFLQEKCAVRFDGKSIILTRSQIENGRDFKAFSQAVQTHFDASLSAVAAAAKAEKVKTVSLILAGGGAALPFVQAMAKQAEKSWRKDARVVFEPLVPAWARGPDFSSSFAALFPQLEVAIGGTSPMIRIGAEAG